eukprot:760467-Hanusia_phi.AAC.10
MHSSDAHGQSCSQSDRISFPWALGSGSIFSSSPPDISQASQMLEEISRTIDSPMLPSPSPSPSAMRIDATCSCIRSRNTRRSAPEPLEIASM